MANSISFSSDFINSVLLSKLIKERYVFNVRWFPEIVLVLDKSKSGISSDKFIFVFSGGPIAKIVLSDGIIDGDCIKLSASIQWRNGALNILKPENLLGSLFRLKGIKFRQNKLLLNINDLLSYFIGMELQLHSFKIDNGIEIKWEDNLA